MLNLHFYKIIISLKQTPLDFVFSSFKGSYHHCSFVVVMMIEKNSCFFKKKKVL